MGGLSVSDPQRADNFEDPFEITQSFTVETRNSGTLLLSGSGSCPPIISAEELSGRHGFVVTVDQAGGPSACTDDLVFYTYEIVTPNEFLPDLAVILSEGEETEELLVTTLF